MADEKLNILTLAMAKRNASKSIPIGVVIPYLGTTGPEGKEWFICDGRDTTGTELELETHYPSLYAFLGNSNVLPDLRECTLVGAGQNATDTIADHDVYTVGQFKDDNMKEHSHDYTYTNLSYQYGDALVMGGSNLKIMTSAGTTTKAGSGNVTHGKQKGVNYIIKAV